MTPDLTPQRPARPAWIIPVVAAAVVLVLAVGGLGTWLYLGSRSIDVAGDITVASLDSVRSVGGTCTTSGGYADIKTGAQVVVKDATGNVVATTTLGPGTGVGGTCTFPFRIEVPSGSDFYGVELGRRGSVQYTADQMADGVHLTIGS